jgi:glutamine synthetase
VAPGQFECAPQFESLNLAVDHNTLLMDVMEAVAAEHGFRVLLHEKPFKGINGSGKHNNWSLITNTGVNLLSPGNSPEQNLQFLTFFINVIKAVHDHADLLRASIATAGNDHRLGANEAPPAIMSVFVGDKLEDVLNNFEADNTSPETKESRSSLRIQSIPEILLDNTDRNRTSPFAFTGNKFEFRAVGSSDNCSSSMVVLNAIVANQLVEFKKRVDAAIASNPGKSTEEIIEEILRADLISAKRIIFGGNGYSQEWVEEAARRGLNNIKNSAEALAAYMAPESVELFTKHGIFSHKELEARTEIRYETFVLSLELELKVLSEMVQNFVIPSAVRYQSRISENVKNLLAVGIDKSSVSAQIELLNELSNLINQSHNLNKKLNEENEKALALAEAHERAIAFNNVMRPIFEELRVVSDEIERLCDDSEWTLPKYRELLTLS